MMKKSTKRLPLFWPTIITIIYAAAIILAIRDMIQYWYLDTIVGHPPELLEIVFSVNKWAMGLYFNLSVFVSLFFMWVAALKGADHLIFVSASIPPLYITTLSIYLLYAQWI